MFTLWKSLLFFAKVSIENLNWLNMVSSRQSSPTILSYLKSRQAGCLFGRSMNLMSMRTPCWCCSRRRRRMELGQLLFVVFCGFEGKVNAYLVAGCPIFNTRLFKQSRSSSFTLYCRSVRCIVPDGSSNPRGSCSNQFILFFFLLTSSLNIASWNPCGTPQGVGLEVWR